MFPTCLFKKKSIYFIKNHSGLSGSDREHNKLIMFIKYSEMSNTKKWSNVTGVKLKRHRVPTYVKNLLGHHDEDWFLSFYLIKANLRLTIMLFWRNHFHFCEFIQKHNRLARCPLFTLQLLAWFCLSKRVITDYYYYDNTAEVLHNLWVKFFFFFQLTWIYLCFGVLWLKEEKQRVVI